MRIASTALSDDDIELLLRYTLIIVASVVFVAVVLGCIDSRKIRKNELFEWSGIIVFLFYTADFISDVFFSGKLLIHSNDVYFLVLSIFSITFILLPIVFNVYQLHVEISKWNEEVANASGNFSTKQVSHWIESRIKFVYLLSFISGSTFSSIALLNSYLFKLEMFSMGLSKQQKASFQNKRIFSVVLLEVKYYMYM